MSLDDWFVAKRGLVDWWSLGHLTWGIVLGLLFILLKNRFVSLGRSKYFFRVGLIIFVLWEIIEVIARYFDEHFVTSIMSPLAEHESWINVFGDIVIDLIGLLVVYAIYRKRFQYEENDKK